jgi:hypothetical protein
LTGPNGAGTTGDYSHPEVPARVPWLRLSGTEARTPPERPVRPRAVLIQVIAGTLAVVIGVAVAGAFASRRVAEREAVTDAAHTTDLIAQQVVQPAWTAADQPITNRQHPARQRQAQPGFPGNGGTPGPDFHAVAASPPGASMT